MPVESLTPNRHLQLVERILHNIVAVKLINPPYNNLHIRLLRLCEQQELRARKSLEAAQSKRAALEHFDPGALSWRGVECGGRERFGDGVHAMECAG